MLRRIPLGKLCNLRDLGGYPTADRRITAWERLLRADNPVGLSEPDVQWLLDRNITTIVDLRTLEETRRAPDQLASRPEFSYHHIPFVGIEKLPNLESDVGLAYFNALDQKHSAHAIMSAIAAAPGGVLYHCTAGKDRTGLVSALLLALVGVSQEDILADYQVSETYLAEIIRHLKANIPNLSAFVGNSRREYMEDCLAQLHEAYGGVPEYLQAIGLTDQELDALRGKLLA